MEMLAALSNVASVRTWTSKPFMLGESWTLTLTVSWEPTVKPVPTNEAAVEQSVAIEVLMQTVGPVAWTYGIPKRLERSSNGVIISIFALCNLVFAPFFSDEGYSLTVNIRVFGLELVSYSRETLQVEKDFCGCLEVYLQKEEASTIWRCTRHYGDLT